MTGLIWEGYEFMKGPSEWDFGRDRLKRVRLRLSLLLRMIDSLIDVGLILPLLCAAEVGNDE